MNLILFESHELGAALPKADRRVHHVLSVLRRGTGEAFDAGVINGPRGKALMVSETDEAVTFAFEPSQPLSPRPPITLIVGLPRPQTARDILRDATTIGVGALHFVRTDKAEASYAQSSLWSSGEWRRHVITGAEQAFDTRLPEVTYGCSLSDVLTAFGSSAESPAQGLALDNYEASMALGEVALPTSARVVLAIGSERGWSAGERDMLRQHGLQCVHLGQRVLRTETAVIAALTLVRARLGLG